MKKKYLNYSILAIIIIITFYAILKDLDYKAFIETVRMADVRYLYIGLFCMFLYWGIEAWLLDILIKKVNPEIKFWTALKTTIIGQYYSYLTPFSSGGQPMQLYEMGKDKMPMGNATAVLVGKFLLYQITITLYSVILAAMRYTHLFGTLKAASGFIITGLLINSIGLTFIVLMAFKPDGLRRVVVSIIGFLFKIHVVKSREKAYERLDSIIEEYTYSMHQFKEDLLGTAMMFLLSAVQITFFFAITYFIYLALGLKGANIWDIISLQALLYMAVSFIPVPGTAGASEAGFALILGSIFTGHLLAVAVLLWRGISYYFGIVFCGIFTLLVYLLDRSRTSLKE